MALPLLLLKQMVLEFIYGMSKNKAVNLLRNSDLTGKRNTLEHKNLISHIKMGKEVITYCNTEIK